MRHGYHMGMGFYGVYIMIFLFVFFCILVFLLIRNKPSPNPFIIRLIDILKEKYASGIITADEYIERKSIIEDTKYSNSYTTILLERYAQCSVNTREFLNLKNQIESSNIDNITREALAKGELSYDEFKASPKSNLN